MIFSSVEKVLYKEFLFLLIEAKRLFFDEISRNLKRMRIKEEQDVNRITCKYER